MLLFSYHVPGQCAQGQMLIPHIYFCSFSPQLRRKRSNSGHALDISSPSWILGFTEAFLQRKTCTAAWKGIFSDKSEESHVGACLCCECNVIMLVLWFSEGIKPCVDLSCSDAFVEGKKCWTCAHSCFFLVHKEGDLLTCYCFHIKEEFCTVW